MLTNITILNAPFGLSDGAALAFFKACCPPLSNNFEFASAV
jgi:hypothetical protein